MESFKRLSITNAVNTDKTDKMVKKYQSNVFNEEPYKGVPQFLYEYSSVPELNKGYRDFDVIDEFDYTFFCKISETDYLVKWKNKNGTVQFCGSGAYALALHILKESKAREITFKLESKSLKAYKENHVIILELPKKESKKIKEDDYASYYFSEDSGMLLMWLKRKDELSNTWKLKQKESELKGLDIHSTCAFYLDDPNSGELRYFVPRYGRDEDYVTGSVQSSLTPLVSQSLGAELLTWTQRSSIEGQSYTKLSKNVVKISDSPF